MFFKFIHLVVIAAALIGATYARAEDPHDMQPLVQALSKSKLTLLDGKLSLSVYTAEKSLAVPAEQNVLEELSGSPGG